MYSHSPIADPSDPSLRLKQRNGGYPETAEGTLSRYIVVFSGIRIFPIERQKVIETLGLEEWRRKHLSGLGLRTILHPWRLSQEGIWIHDQ